ncbi:FAS1-like dehydratase domain-containing protein [Arthrobacter sp. zg-Y769]|uniref:FAS1-like dehydratase domain-containing protein n=1 Tax=Arthrobacter sp. zg-Y769 TaxID=2894191 RepID=UPI001E2FC3B1|nr:MaoC family dehydratase N-terminal domain-containing protein [Arthrobacter sp. zg-Y769]MCC9203854.1 MaoC family dehydratase N-terminal domain-containing protein [Arthrobacter sp. zg-Y769]
MSINPQLLGRTYPAGAAYSVGREKIREFAAAVKATNPAHFDVDSARELGYADLVAPPTFAIIVAQRADALLVADPDAGIDFSRVVHADQRFTHHRPIVAGDELVAELHVDSVRAMGDGALITTRAEISTTEGEQVATTLSSILVRGEGQ